MSKPLMLPPERVPIRKSVCSIHHSEASDLGRKKLTIEHRALCEMNENDDSGAGQQAQAHLRVARKQVPLAAEGHQDRPRPRQERRV